MLKKEIDKRAEIVNNAIKELLQIKEPEGLYLASMHLIKAGGKRLRPVISLLTSECLGKDYKKILPAIVSIEVIHNFTLIHDDIMDRDEFRRGVPTVHRVYGEPVAILAGDTLFAEAFRLITMCDVKHENIIKAVSKLAEVCIKICEGQYLDISYEKRDYITEEEYLKMIELKTATLIACSSALPAILFGEDEKVFESLWKFGLYCGMGFQIHDDILDLIGKDIGKDWGSDLLKGKKTLIVIKAMEKGIELETFGKGKANTEKIKRDVEKLLECGAIEYARKKALEFVEKGKEYLKILPDSKPKQILIELADYLVTREK